VSLRLLENPTGQLKLRRYTFLSLFFIYILVSGWGHDYKVLLHIAFYAEMKEKCPLKGKIVGRIGLCYMTKNGNLQRLLNGLVFLGGGWEVLGFELRAFALSHSTSPIFVKDFYR
jgi:hypothetical protein